VYSCVLTDLLKIATQQADIVNRGVPKLGYSKLRSSARCIKRLSIINRRQHWCFISLFAAFLLHGFCSFLDFDFQSFINIPIHDNLYRLGFTRVANGGQFNWLCNCSGKLKFRVLDPRVRYYSRIVRVKAKRWNSLSIWPLTSLPSGENNTSVMK